MQIANDPSDANFRASFGGVREAALGYTRAAGLNFHQFENILDFGCGVGRFLFAMREIAEKNQKFFGCDINADCADWCAENIGFAQISKASSNPPLPYANNSMDYINAVSVFTHLTLEAQFSWAWEIYRILRPGGIIALTTNGHSHMPFLLNLPEEQFPIREFWGFGADGFFGSLAQDESKEIEGQREVVTMYSPEALATAFFPLEVLYHKPISSLAGGQAISVMQKPKLGNILRPQSQDTDGVKFTFPKQNFSSKFRCYVSFETDGFNVRGQEIHYALTDADDLAPKFGQVQIGLNRIFGTRQLIPINIDVPAQDHDFVVVIGRAPDSRLPKMNINFPHLIAVD